MEKLDTKALTSLGHEHRIINDLLLICYDLLHRRAEEAQEKKQPLAYKKIKKQCDRIVLMRKQLKNDFYETK